MTYQHNLACGLDSWRMCTEPLSTSLLQAAQPSLRSRINELPEAASAVRGQLSPDLNPETKHSGDKLRTWWLGGAQ